MAPNELLLQPRWQPIADFIAAWHAEPLGGSGLSTADIERTEERLGHRLPVVLKEWYLLAGHRIHDFSQDQAVRLERLRIEGERLPIWYENQGNWSFEVELGSDDVDPWVVVESSEPSWCRRARLTVALLGMLYSDTLVGAWGRGRGPLGRLASDVVGGFPHDVSGDGEKRVASLPVLDVLQNPYFDEPFRGHAELVIRHNNGPIWEWMARSEAARAQAIELLGTEDGQW